MVEILEDITEDQREQLKKNLQKSGLELMGDKKSILIEKNKKCHYRNDFTIAMSYQKKITLAISVIN